MLHVWIQGSDDCNSLGFMELKKMLLVWIHGTNWCDSFEFMKLINSGSLEFREIINVAH